MKIVKVTAKQLILATDDAIPLWIVLFGIPFLFIVLGIWRIGLGDWGGINSLGIGILFFLSSLGCGYIVFYNGGFRLYIFDKAQNRLWIRYKIQPPANPITSKVLHSFGSIILEEDTDGDNCWRIVLIKKDGKQFPLSVYIGNREQQTKAAQTLSQFLQLDLKVIPYRQ